MRGLSLLVLFGACLIGEHLNAQSYNFRRLAPGGAFRVPTFWTPFAPGDIPPILGPGDVGDRVIFDLGKNLRDTYTITDVNGVNDQLIVENDSVALQFSDYEVVNNGGFESIIVGSTDGDVADAIFTGSAGSPDLISNGAVIGLGQGSIGTVTAQGGNLTWDSECILVGEAGIGTLNIMDGALVSNANALIGVNENATGTVAVNGNSSLWFNTGFLWVGVEGHGSLAISNGGEVSNTSATIGTLDFSIGTVIVTGEDSVWTTDEQLFVGNSIKGDGTLTIEQGGTATCDTGLIGTGQVNVIGTGSTLTTADYLTVGENGDGTLNIQDGGEVHAGTDLTIAGEGPYSVGKIVVDGPGSSLDAIIVSAGSGGDGMLFIENGGALTSQTIRIADDNDDDSTATTIVDGPGSCMILTSFLVVGNWGPGTLNILNRAAVYATDCTVANDLNTSSFVTIDSGGTLLVHERLTVGDIGDGYLSIQGGGQVFCAGAIIGGPFYVNGTGDVTVAGDGSILEISDRLSIGNFGTGRLKIEDGADVSVTEETFLFPDGVIELRGGTFSTDAICFEGGGEFDWTGGNLQVGTYEGDLDNNGGTLAPGSPIGSTTIQGSYQQGQDATLELEIGGTIVNSEYDFVNVFGNALLDGNLELSLINEFVPESGDTFAVLSAGSIAGFFSNVSDNERLNTVDGAGSFLVRYGPTSPNPNQIILSDFQPIANVILGDANDDGVFDNLDIAFFVLALTSPSTYQAMFPDLDPDIVLDMNNDGVFDNLDIAAFVAALTGP